MRDARNRLGFNPAQMAATLKVPTDSYTLWELGDEKPPVGACWRAEELAEIAPASQAKRRRGRPPGKGYSPTRALCDGTRTANEIANQLGVTPAAVYNLARKEGLPLKRVGQGGSRGQRGRPPMSAEDIATRNAVVRTMWEDGATLGETGKLLGVTRERIRQIEKKLGLPSRQAEVRLRHEETMAMREERREAKAKARADNIEAIEAMLKAGLSLNKARLALGLTLSQTSGLSRGRNWGKLSLHGRWRDDAPSKRGGRA